MKRLLTVLCSAMLLTACAEKPDSAVPVASMPDVTTNDPFAETTQADDYDPFAVSDETEEDDVDYAWSGGVEWEPGKELVLDYAPTVTFPYFFNNSAKRNDFGLLIFVNGFRQPYRTDTEPDDRIMHTFVVDRDEKIHPKISFEPIAGDMGETLSVETIGMLTPSFTLTDQTTDAALNFHHHILAPFPSELTVTQKTDLTPPAVCSNYTEVPVTEELRKQYQRSGENVLDKPDEIILEALKNDGLITPADRLKAPSQSGIAKTVFSGDDSITLCMLGGGTPCRYRVSMYLNHELVRGVFDGCDYIDMTPSADTMCKKEIDMSRLELPQDEFSHFYFIAVPFYTEKYSKRMAVKSESAAISDAAP